MFFSYNLQGRVKGNANQKNTYNQKQVAEIIWLYNEKEVLGKLNLYRPY